MLCELSTYEIISICLTIGMFVLAGVSIWIAIWSSRQATKEVNRLINDTNRATRAQIGVEIQKLEVEKFRMSMQIVELEEKKNRLMEYPNQNQEFLLEPPIHMQVSLIDEQLDRLDKLHTKVGVVQADLREILKICR